MPGELLVFTFVEANCIDTSAFFVQSIPDPKVTIGGMLHPVGNSNCYKVQNGLVAVLMDFPFDVEFKVLSFDFFLQQNQESFYTKNSGPLFSPVIKDKLSNLQSGDVFCIQNIKVIGTDGVMRNLYIPCTKIK
jgi:hypothetical protein